MIYRWLEFHDSDIQAVRSEEHAVVMQLCGYIHQWEQSPSGWNGTGWTQRVDLHLYGADSIAAPESGVWISDGDLRVGDVLHRNMVSLPFRADGSVRLSLVLETGETVEVSADSVELVCVGEPEFVEPLTDDLRPPLPARGSA